MMRLSPAHRRWTQVLAAGALMGSVSAQLVRSNARLIDTRNGLSHDQVNAMVRDQRGHMWFGTSDGLSRFDGTHVRVFSTSSKTWPLSNDHINALAIDSIGLLYVGSQGPWLTVLDPLADTLQNIPLPGGGALDVAAVEISAITVDGRQRIWVGHGHRNLSLFDLRSRTFRTTVIRTPNSHPQGRNWIRRIVEGDDGFLWLCCEFGLVRFDPRDFSYIHYPSDRSSPTAYQYAVATALDEGPTLLIGAFGQGLWRVDKGTGAYRTVGDNRALFVMDMLDLGDRVLIATVEKGLMELDRRSGTSASFDRNLTPTRSRERSDFLPGAQCFFRDPEDGVWIGTMQTGVALIAGRGNRFTLHALPVSESRSSPSDVIRVAVHPITKEWVVLTLREGSYTMDSTGKVTGHTPGPWSNGSHAMFQDLLIAPEGRIWVGSSDELFIVDQHARRFVPAALRIDDRFCHDVQGLWADGRHGLWGDIGGQGLLHLDTLSGSVSSIDDLAPGIRAHLQYPLRDLVIDAQDRIWIAMTSRPPVVIWPDGHFSVWKSPGEEPDGLPSVFLTTLCEGSDGTMWAGTWSDGLIGMRMDAKGRMEHQRLTTSQGLPSNTIYELVRAYDGAIWGTGKSGVFRFDPSSGEVRRSGIHDGLPTPEIYLALDISPDGQRVFGGLFDGLLTFHVDSLRPRYRAPHVQIPVITVFDSAVVRNADLGTADMRLPHDRSDLRFVLRSTNMVDPFNDVYAYRLGPDTNWTVTPAQDAITFSQIPPGAHVFEVKARTSIGAWGPVSRVPFTILPPWWSTWWFRSAMLLCTCLLAYVAFRTYLYMRLRRQREEHDREQAVMQERIRIASDMHDDLGGGLSVIKVKSEIALLTETDPARAGELQEIARGSGELIDNMRQIVWTLGSGQETLADLVAYMRSYAGRFLDQHGIKCVFRSDGLPDRALTAIERRNLLLILKEALHNVVKHARATRVNIDISWDQGLRLAIADDGRGMDAHRQATFGMGMSSMRQRMEQLGGTMRLEKQDGTTLVFHLLDPGSAERSIVHP